MFKLSLFSLNTLSSAAACFAVSASVAGCSPSLLDATKSSLSSPCTYSSGWTTPLLVEPDVTETSTIGNGVYAAPTGVVYSFGYGYGAAGVDSANHIYKSIDHGLTWSLQDSYIYPGGGGTYATMYGMSSDTAGYLFDVGSTSEASGESHWIVRRSADGGATWSVVDDFQATAGEWSLANAIAVDSNNNIYVVGLATDGSASPAGINSNAMRMLVRKSTNNGTSWTTVDDFTNAAAPHTFYGGVIAIDKSDNVYVSGGSYSNGGVATWIVRKSANGGASWNTVDSYVYNGTSQEAYVTSLRVGPDGSIYVVGYAGYDGTAGKQVGLVRSSTNQGSTWSNFLEFKLAANQSSYASDIVFASNGDMFVNGDAYDSGGVGHWYVARYDSASKSWGVSDLFRGTFVTNQIASWGTMTISATGDIMATGYGTLGSGDYRWVIRRLSCR